MSFGNVCLWLITKGIYLLYVLLWSRFVENLILANEEPHVPSDCLQRFRM